MTPHTLHRPLPLRPASPPLPRGPFARHSPHRRYSLSRCINNQLTNRPTRWSTMSSYLVGNSGRWTVPMAERLYDLIAAGKPFPSYLTVDPTLLALAFKDKNREQQLVAYGGFLHHLEVWQDKSVFREFGRWPFMYDWEGRLKEVVEKYKEQIPKKT